MKISKELLDFLESKKIADDHLFEHISKLMMRDIDKLIEQSFPLPKDGRGLEPIAQQKDPLA